MRILAAILLGFSLVAHGQTKAPLKRELLPTHPVIDKGPTDKLTRSLVAEMMPFVAPLVIETREVKSKLILASTAKESTYATVIFHSLSGSKQASQRVTFLPHEKKEIVIDSFKDGLPENDRWGSITVEQDPKTSGVVIAGQVVITDLRSSVPAYVDEELAMPDMEGSTRLIAVTDQSEDAPLVALTNIDSSIQHVTVTCMRESSKAQANTVTLKPHASSIVTGCRSTENTSLSEYLSSIKEDGHGVYGLEVAGDGDPGSLAAFALAPHYHGRDTVFSAVPFYDPNLLHSRETIFSGVPIGTQPTLPYGTYVPRLSYANFSAAPLHLSVSLADSSTSTDDGDTDDNRRASKIQSLTVAPHQSGEFVFKGMESSSGLSHSVIVKGDGDPGSYQAKLVSRSDGRLYQVELLAKDGLDINNSGIHPWSIDDETESHLILFNHSSTPKKVGFTITSGSKQWRHEFMLAGMETREISFNNIEKEKTPDDFGRLLPTTAKEGVVNWMSPDSGYVAGRLMVTSRNAAMARNFSCGGYVVLCRIYFNTLANFILDGGTEEMYEDEPVYCTATEPLQCAGGSTTTEGTASSNWTVGAATIIRLNSSSEGSKTSPLLKGVSGGSGTASVNVEAGGCEENGSGNPTVQVPTYFYSPSETSVSLPAACSNAGYHGQFIDVSYYVADANGNRISQSGMAPGENVTGTWNNTFATPTTTRSDGSFDDTPNGGCFAETTHFCAAGNPQSFQITYGAVYPISTNTTTRQCTDGLKLVIQGNVPASQNKTYIVGNVE